MTGNADLNVADILRAAQRSPAVKDAITEAGLAVFFLLTHAEARARYCDALVAIDELRVAGIPDNEFERWQQADRLRAGQDAIASLAAAGRQLENAMRDAEAP